MVQVRDVMGPGSALSRALGGYEAREGQLRMATAVESALASEHPLFVEAGTGTGKTLAYLIPAALSGKKVVISTGTRALQDQIVGKDLPLVAQVLAPHGIRFRSAMMKGLSNYLCKRRFEELRQTDADRFVLDTDLVHIERWVPTSPTGDRVELSMLPDDSRAWYAVQSSTDTRIGKGCAYNDTCFVTQMKREAEEADLVIVNHHLFFADLALRRGLGRGPGGRRPDMASVIPAYDAVIFDEAHQLEDVATTFFGIRASSARIDALVRDAYRTLAAAGRGEARGMLDRIEHASDAFFRALVKRAGTGAAETRRPLAHADLDGPTYELFGKLLAHVDALATYADAFAREGEPIALIARRAADLKRDLTQIVEGARAAGGKRNSADDPRARFTEEGGAASRARFTEEEAHSSHAPFSDEQDPDALDEEPDDEEPPMNVAWVEARDKSVVIGSSPVHVGGTLRGALFDRVSAVVCTSATLATAGGFHFAKARLGATANAQELIVASPFDYAARAGFYVAKDLPDPSQPGFEAAAAERILELVEMTKGGAFVLATSNRAMRNLCAILRSRLREPVLLQGEAPKHLLLERFRQLGNAVLVATMSFWEGVDVPGHALRLVILDKIPFAVPTDPLVASRSAEVERQGGNPFAQYSVPAAAILLKQGFGRLLRTRKDGGVIALLDRRATTRGYGRMLLASLPPAKRLGNMDDVRAFWRELGLDLGTLV
ncbi:ATP-dependent DNA helicase [Pendulispora albinea]|uniref:DNA 5'-3' helicase n=1 Tax=Pendulispora albinea TaxID=2741071 RepID=A0ABZ2M9D7_9BACT